MNEMQAAIFAYFNHGAMPPKDESWEPPAPAGSTYWGPRGDNREKELNTEVKQAPKLAPGIWE